MQSLKQKRKKVGPLKWLGSFFLWFLSPVWASSLWEKWTETADTAETEEKSSKKAQEPTLNKDS